jgi:DNA invertase Pin-like site-specific DNA recombinase
MDIGLARVSTRDQNPQLQIIALEQAGCWPIYEEKVSGVSDKRPVRNQALAQLKAGDTLTVWKLDRLGRSAVELLEIVKDLEARGIRFRCLTQNIDTSTPMGRMFLTLLAGFAEFEREVMRERVIAGKARMIADGEHPGGVPLYGFQADHVTINEPEAQLLREAARRLLKGEALSRIVEDWNDRGVRPRRGQRWRETPLREMLRNPRVVPIIGQETYDKLARLFANPGNRRQKLGRPAENLGSGILRCGREGCGQPMYVSKKAAKGGVPRTNYRCHKTGGGGRFAGCGSMAVSQDRADAWLAEAFIAAIVSDDFAEALNRRRAELLAGEVTAAQVDAWREEMDELELIMPTRFGTSDHRQRHDELQRMVRQATAGLLQRPDLQALLELPKSEEKLRDAWNGWTVAERRVWLRRVFVFVIVKPATAKGRASDVESRMDPVWKI